jgi:hypothetical protein
MTKTTICDDDHNRHHNEDPNDGGHAHPLANLPPTPVLDAGDSHKAVHGTR